MEKVEWTVEVKIYRPARARHPADTNRPPPPPRVRRRRGRHRRPRHRRPAGGRQDRPARAGASGGRRRARAAGHAPPACAPRPRHRRRRAPPARPPHLERRRVHTRRSAAAAAASTGDDRTCLLFPVDHRSRMNPPLPGKYLGNYVDPALALAPKDALAAGGAGGLLSACAAVAAGRHRRGGGRRRDGQHGRVDGPRQGGRRCDEHSVRGRLAEVPRLRAGPGVRPAGESGHRDGKDRRGGGGGEPARRRRRGGGGRPSAAGWHGPGSASASPTPSRGCTRRAELIERLLHSTF
ncbi:hypothetical protein PVAP13_6KG250606 [Panicum virgatum]|uniref:Uncharacterized protein n=1 Tax=Panicum virgatum TaxID=38727 RepID=A0A8T0RDG3_PANVG|nr:hypothetical protein PVAP13_6KG250606 [Panicum virgatum]